LAAVPSIGRATRVERPVAPGADAASVLYERYSSQIFSYCLHQLGSREEAEDAVQTTFMNAFRGLSRGIVPELESAWLFKIAHNVCLSRRRSSWRRGKVEAPNNFEVLQEVIPGREQVADELIRLQDVLAAMPENQRRAILLREWQGLTYREISAELDLSQAAVETLIFRARRALAAGLEKDADNWKSRLRRGSDFGGIAGVLQALLSGGSAAAVKVAATAVVVATTAVASAPAIHQSGPASTHRAPAAKHAKAVRGTHRFVPLGMSRDRIAQPHATKVSSGPIHSGDRGAPKPVALPSSDPDATTSTPPPAAVSEGAPPAVVQPSEPSPTPPAPPPGQDRKPQSSAPPIGEQPPPAVSPPPSAAPGPDSGKGKKDGKDSVPEASIPPLTTPDGQPPASNAPASDGQPQDAAPAGKDKSSKRDRNGGGATK